MATADGRDQIIHFGISASGQRNRLPEPQAPLVDIHWVRRTLNSLNPSLRTQNSPKGCGGGLQSVSQNLPVGRRPQSAQLLSMNSC